VERLAKPFEGTAHRRLTKSATTCRTRDLTLFEQRVQGLEEIEIGFTDMCQAHAPNVYHAFDRYSDGTYDQQRNARRPLLLSM